MEALSVETFDEALSNAEGLVLVDFWAPWCGPCQVVRPTLEAVEQLRPEGVQFFQVNVEDEPALMKAFNLRSVPTVLLLKPREGGAQVVDAQVGVRTADAYLKWLDGYLYPKPSLFQRMSALLKGGSPNQ